MKQDNVANSHPNETQSIVPAESSILQIQDNVDLVTESEPELNVPDGGYGWVCVAACFTTNAFTWGVVSVSIYPSDLES